MAPFTFQNATNFNAASLTGNQLSTGNNSSIMLWFTPASSYDGSIAFQFSPDGGTTWFALPFYDVTSAIGTALYTLASPGASKAYVAAIPTNAIVRLLMSGGTQGTLTAYGLLTSFLAP